MIDDDLIDDLQEEYSNQDVPDSKSLPPFLQEIFKLEDSGDKSETPFTFINLGSQNNERSGYEKIDALINSAFDMARWDKEQRENSYSLVKRSKYEGN